MISIADLASELQIHRSVLHRRVKKLGITAIKRYTYTDRGIQLASFVSLEQADKLREPYRVAEESRRMSTRSVSESNSLDEVGFRLTPLEAPHRNEGS